MSVPFMSWCNVAMQRAIATSAALGWPIVLSGAIGYVIAGWSQAKLPEYSVGFVYLPALMTPCNRDDRGCADSAPKSLTPACLPAQESLCWYFDCDGK